MDAEPRQVIFKWREKADICRRKKISLTHDTYSHVIPSMQTEAADQFELSLDISPGTEWG